MQNSASVRCSSPTASRDQPLGTEPSRAATPSTVTALNPASSASPLPREANHRTCELTATPRHTRGCPGPPAAAARRRPASRPGGGPDRRGRPAGPGRPPQPASASAGPQGEPGDGGRGDARDLRPDRSTGPAIRTTTNSAPKIASNRVSTFARRTRPTVRPGVGGAALTCPAAIRARTAARSSPTAAADWSSVTAASHRTVKPDNPGPRSARSRPVSPRTPSHPSSAVPTSAVPAAPISVHTAYVGPTSSFRRASLATPASGTSVGRGGYLSELLGCHEFLDAGSGATSAALGKISSR